MGIKVAEKLTGKQNKFKYIIKYFEDMLMYKMQSIRMHLNHKIKDDTIFKLHLCTRTKNSHLNNAMCSIFNGNGQH